MAMSLNGEPSDWPKGAMPQKLVKWLFGQMLVKWGKQYVDKWSVVNEYELEKQWGKALFGLTEIEFRRGVAKLNEFDRPPSQPEFLKACRPEVNPLTAYYEAVEGCRSRDQGEVGTWSHPAIFWASVRVSGYELKNQTYSQIRGRWEAALAAELAKQQWDDIPAPMVALPAPGNKLSKETATKMMQQIKERTGIMPGQVDGKAWARKLEKREKSGEKLLPIQRSMWRDALKYEDNESE